MLTERGVELPLPGQSTTTPEDRMEKELAVQKKVVGAARVDALYASAPTMRSKSALPVGQLLRRPHVARDGFGNVVNAQLRSQVDCRSDAVGSATRPARMKTTSPTITTHAGNTRTTTGCSVVLTSKKIASK